MFAIIRTPILGIGIAMLAGGLLWGLNFEPLWGDESFSAHVTDLPYGQILSPELDPAHPPAYYLALKAWSTFGDGDTWLRLLSVAFGAAAVPFVYAIGRTLGGARVGILSMLIFLTVPAVYALVTDMRSYAMLLFLGAVCTWCALQVATRDDLLLWKWAALWLGVVVTGTLMLWTHHLAWLWVPFVAVGCLPACIADRRRLLVAAGIGLLGVGVYLAAFLPYLVSGLSGDDPHWALWRIKSVPALLTLALLGNGREMPLAALGMLAASWLAFRAWYRSGDRRLALFVGAIAFAPVLMTAVTAGVLPDLIPHPKSLLVIYPLFAAVAAYGICRMRIRWGAAVLTFLLACNMAGIAIFAAGDKAPPWDDAGRIIEDTAPGSAVVICEPVPVRILPHLGQYGLLVQTFWYGNPDGFHTWNKQGWMPVADIPTRYDNIWTVQNAVWPSRVPECKTPPSWGEVTERLALRYDRLHLWHIMSGREKEHSLIIDRYQPNGVNAR